MPSKDQLLDVIAIQAEIAKLGLDLGGTMALVVDRTLPLIGADGAAIELAENDEMVYRAASGIAANQLGLRLKLAGSLSGLCVQTATALSCDDSELDERVDRAACRHVGLRSMIVVPLRHQGETVGVLKAMSAQPGKFHEIDKGVLELLTEVIAAAMYFATKYNIDELFYKATHDAMTGLANRALFIDRLRSIISQRESSSRSTQILLIDMNGLKGINDTHGHRAGDAAITEFANRLTTCTRQGDTVARVGGDEFGIILSPIDPTHGVEAIIQRINDEKTPLLYVKDQPFRLTASIGVARFPDDGSDIDSLLEVADQRMYQMKRAGRGN